MRKQKKLKEDNYKLFGSIIDSFEIPEEVVINIPIIHLLGNREIEVENFKAIMTYSDSLIKLSTNEGFVAVKGKNLEAKSMTSEVIKIKGHIEGVLFEE